MKPTKLAATAVLAISAITISPGAMSASIVNSGPAGAKVKDLASKKFRSSLYGYVQGYRDGSNRYVRIMFSNGTRTDYAMAAGITCKAPNGTILASNEFKVAKLGWSNGGAVERQKLFKVDCPAPNTLEVKFDEPRGDLLTSLEWQNVLLKLAAVYAGTITF